MRKPFCLILHAINGVASFLFDLDSDLLVLIRPCKDDAPLPLVQIREGLHPFFFKRTSDLVLGDHNNKKILKEQMSLSHLLMLKEMAFKRLHHFILFRERGIE